MPEPLPIVVIGAGPVGLTAALGLAHYGLDVQVFEEDSDLSLDTKAGTLLARTVEVFDRYGAAPDVLAASLRIDEIGEIDRQTNAHRDGVLTGTLTEDTRHPYALNIPQHHLEPVLRGVLERVAPGALQMQHTLRSLEQHDDHVELLLRTPEGEKTVRASYVVACDGGRSTVRRQLGIAVLGETLEERFMLVDLIVDLDTANPRDYPYLSYFGDPAEWMIVVRLPHCWRLLYPLPAGEPEPTNDELLAKARRFIGDVTDIELIGTNIYSVHHRVAERMSEGRVFLLGDAAHLITPMWALGLNSGVLDASNLPWRLAWVLRGWAAPSLLDGYGREQGPLARDGAARMAEAARKNMARTGDEVELMKGGRWGVAATRNLLAVSLDVDGTGDWGMIAVGDEPNAVKVGDRAPDLPLHSPRGPVALHSLVADSFVALYFCDARRAPRIPETEYAGLTRYVVSRWDAPLDTRSGTRALRDLALFDPGSRVEKRFAVAPDSVVLIRPDGHVAAILPFDPHATEDDRAAGSDGAGEKYQSIIGRG
jgi:3-(3-hydroxy-phenyl)propionate hydroxylase